MVRDWDAEEAHEERVVVQLGAEAPWWEDLSVRLPVQNHWTSRPPPPTFADSWGFTLPDAYQAPLATTWAAVHFRCNDRNF